MFFKHGLHELAPALELLYRLLEIPRELIDLRAAVAQLRGHGVEGTHQDSQLILSLLRDLVIKVAGGNLPGSFRERLNGDSDLLGQKQRHPHDGGQQQHGEKKENQQHLILQCTKILLFLVILVGLGLNGRQPIENVWARTIGGNDESASLAPCEAGTRAPK